MGEMVVVGSNANGYDWVTALVLYATIGTVFAVLILGLLAYVFSEEEEARRAGRDNRERAALRSIASELSELSGEARDSNTSGHVSVPEVNRNNHIGIKTSLAILLLLGGYVIGYFAIIGPWFGDSVKEQDQRFHQQALERATAAQEEYKGVRLYLKEETTDPGTWGEIKGSFGGFLFINGSIYGKIEYGKVLTVVYLQPEEAPANSHYAGKHLIYSKPLDEVVIVTTPVGSEPYLKFSEAFYRKNVHRERYEVHPGKPHLYLPEGWEILK